MKNIEKWKPIPGYEGVYSASSAGRIQRELTRTRGKAGAMLKPHVVKDGYRMAVLYRDGVRKQQPWHRVIALAFLGPPPSLLHQVNHKNGKRTQNNIANLEYVTCAENQAHARRVLGMTHEGERNGRAKITERDVRAIRARYAAGGITQTALAREYGLEQPAISAIVLRQKWAHISP